MPHALLGLDATAQLSALASRRLSAQDLLEACIARNAEVTSRLNAVVDTDFERARERARAIDDLRAKGEPVGPLAGLPMTIKDTLDVEGMPASAGLDALRHRMVKDAVAVGHVRRAGALIWAKTNVPVMAGDWQSYNSVYGATNNPWDQDRTPGGSSGGAAAALAAGITALEVGSDIGGSLRVPASFCGVFSHKPTYGLVSQIGHIPPLPGSFSEPDLNVIGPMARSARDLRLLLSVLQNGPMAGKGETADLTTLKVGLWLEDPAFVLDAEVRAVIETFAGQLSAQGAQVKLISSPVNMAELFEAYLTLLMSIMGGGLAPKAYRGMARLRGPARLARAAGAGPMSWAASVLGMTASHAEWMAADDIRTRAGAAIKDAFNAHDVIIAPIAPVTAFPHNHRPFNSRKLTCSNGLKIPYPSMLQWISLATALGLPATAAPVGLAASGLPVGVQIIGPRGADAKTLAVAQAIDENIGGFVAPPLDL
jgi:amidase